MDKIRIDFIHNFYEKDGKQDKEQSHLTTGRIAGVCYDQEGYSALLKEPKEKSYRRNDGAAKKQHHSVSEHVRVTLNITNIPKILAMVLNNEQFYSTSEKSTRYTYIDTAIHDIFTQREVELYEKWLNIFKIRINEKYPGFYSNFQTKILAQENARYMVTVFLPTTMVHSIEVRQLNYIISWMYEYINNANYNDYFQKTLSEAMLNFIEEIERLNLIEKDFLNNFKQRELSLFKKRDKIEEFGETYTTTYLASFVALAHLHRHRTLDYEMDYTKDLGYYIPPILRDDPLLVSEWLKDIESVQEIYPLGKLLEVTEQGKYEKFILKCKERLCTHAQIETCDITKETLYKYKKALEEKNHPLKDDIANYTHGARCTFKDFTCVEDCKNKLGKRLERKI